MAVNASTGLNGFSEEGVPDNWDFAIGEVMGYRWWKLAIPAGMAGYEMAPVYRVEDHPLQGANSKSWYNGVNEAACAPSYLWGYTGSNRSFQHEPPEYRESCACGFWAYFDPDIRVEHVLGGLDRAVANNMGEFAQIPVYGVVRGTGRVIIGEKGFRSQYAEILGLAIPDCVPVMLSVNIKKMTEFEMEKAGYTNLHRVSSSQSIKGLLSGLAKKGTAIVVGKSEEEYSYAQTHLQRMQKTYAAMGGSGNRFARGGSLHTPYENVVTYPDYSTKYEVVTLATETEKHCRLAAVEGILSAAYPSAKIFSDQGNLINYFGFDKNYGPGSAFALDIQYGGD